MSYEGFEVRVCKNGHYNCYCVHGDEDEKCPDCGADFEHCGHVDETNGLPFYLNFYLEKTKDSEFKACKECDHKERTASAEYKFCKCDTYISEDGGFIGKPEEEQFVKKKGMTYEEQKLLEQAVYIINQVDMAFNEAENILQVNFERISKNPPDFMVKLFLPNYIHTDSQKFLDEYEQLVKEK